MEEQEKITDLYPSVVATKYKLQTKKTVGNKQIWDINCPARVKQGSAKLQLSEHVEEMNSVDNNIYFEIDEKATIEAHEKNRARQAKQAEEDQLQKMSTGAALAQVVSAMNIKAEKPKKSKPTEKKQESKEDDLAQLQAKYEEVFGEKPHHKTTATTLQAKIEAEESKNK